MVKKGSPGNNEVLSLLGWENTSDMPSQAIVGIKYWTWESDDLVHHTGHFGRDLPLINIRFRNRNDKNLKSINILINT